jgi:hypothetical protein
MYEDEMLGANLLNGHPRPSSDRARTGKDAGGLADLMTES